MKAHLRLLHLEDDPQDAELIRSNLEKEAFDCDIVLAQTKADFLAALTQGRYDIILSDFGLVDYDGLSALEAAQKALPDVPFILVSGTLGEDQAVECLKTGATDYVLKDRLSRLVPAVRRALDEARKRMELKGHGELILVVDDEPQIRSITGKNLERNGYRTLQASDGLAALAVFTRHRNEINTVLTDLDMPHMDGIALVRAIRKMAPDMRVIASSGIGSAQDLGDRTAKLNELGVHTLLAKPYTVNALLEALEQIIGEE